MLRDVPIVVPGCGECLYRQLSDGSGSASTSRRNGGVMVLLVGPLGVWRCAAQGSMYVFCLLFGSLC